MHIIHYGIPRLPVPGKASPVLAEDLLYTLRPLRDAGICKCNVRSGPKHVRTRIRIGLRNLQEQVGCRHIETVAEWEFLENQEYVLWVFGDLESQSSL